MSMCARTSGALSFASLNSKSSREIATLLLSRWKVLPRSAMPWRNSLTSTARAFWVFSCSFFRNMVYGHRSIPYFTISEDEVDLPESQSFRTDGKNFFFDPGHNNRGDFLKITEVNLNLCYHPYDTPRTLLTIHRKIFSVEAVDRRPQHNCPLGQGNSAVHFNA
jgi:hypothetical protein